MIKSESRNKRLFALVIFTLPFLLNDFSNIFVKDYRLWLIIDYVIVRLSLLLFAIYLVRNRIASLSDFGIVKINIPKVIFLVASLSVIGIGIDQIGWRFFFKILPNTQMGSMPPIPNPIVNKLDLYLGLLFAGFIEEVIFRGFYFNVLRDFIDNIFLLVLISSAVFGLIHWSNGLHAIISTSMIGVLFMVVVWKTKSVIPLIIVHFIINFVAYSGLLPQDWFNFLRL